MRINLELSQHLANALNAPATLCYDNARRAIRKHYRNALYVEGLAVSNNGEPEPVYHAWLEWNGEILDPTWCDLSLPMPISPRRSGPERHIPMLALAYFPVLELNLMQLDVIQPQASQAWHWPADSFIWVLVDPQDEIFTDQDRQRAKQALNDAYQWCAQYETELGMQRGATY